MERKVIDLSPFTLFGGQRSLNLGGKDYGTEVREKLNLDSFEEESMPCEIVIPEYIDFISTGFFVGLFGPSIHTLKTVEEFHTRYMFTAPNQVLSDISHGILRIYEM